MAKLRFRISISLDGYVAGPNQSVKEPLGEGGERLHEWVFGTRWWKQMQGESGGEENPSSAVAAETFQNVGASIMGRNMFGGHPGPWNPAKPWTGWWGAEPPYHHPVFVLTHHPREPLEMEGGTTFYFVTEGIVSALQQAKKAAGNKDISIHGGAKTIQQYLAAGHVDELQLSIAPMLLAGGERLLDNVNGRNIRLEHLRTLATPEATHVKYRVIT